MSHFSGLVMIDKAYFSSPEDRVKELIAPYWEEKEVDEYAQYCDCGDSGLYKKSMNLAEQEIGKTRDQIDEEFRVRFQAPDIYRDDPEHEDTMTYGEFNYLWDDAMSPLIKARKRHMEVLRAEAEHNPNCDTCNGTGTYMSTYNPDSKWDWYQVGGRFEDFPGGSVCKVSDLILLAQKFMEMLELEKENRTNNDRTPLIVTQERFMEENGVSILPFPYVFVSKNGEWREKGNMGWWGMSSDNKDPESWYRELLDMYCEHKDCIAVLVDFHI